MHSRIQQQRPIFPVPEPLENMALVGDGGQVIDKDGSGGAGAGGALRGGGTDGITIWGR